MSRFRRLALWLAPLLVGVASMALPGRAQQATSSRFAFADTLLLRDTLGLDFSRLYPTADSLSVIPDSLRAWMIRWRLPIPRMLAMADSLGYPVDSVGPVIDRERFNVFSRTRSRAPVTTFTYGSTYNVQQTSNTWTNTSTFSHSRGSAIVQNNMEVRLQRITTAGRLVLNQTRTATPQADWSITKGHSIGGGATLYRTLDYTNGAGVTQQQNRSEFNLKGRSLTTPLRNLTSDINVLSGYENDDQTQALKRALTGEVRGRLRYSMRLFTSDLNGRVRGNRAVTRARGGLVDQNARDLTHDLNGTVAVLQNSPLGLVSNYRLSSSRVQTPLGDTAIRSIETANNSLDATLKGRVDNERYMTVTASLRRTLQSNGDRTDRTGSTALRWTVLGWGVDATYRDNRGEAIYPRSGTAGGYDERSTGRSANATASRQFGRITTKLTSDIGLDRVRYKDTSPGASHSADRDTYRQSYRVDGKITGGRGFSNDLGLEVGLTSLVNIPGSATATNNDTRRYRAEWRWSYQLLEGLTANQMNSITAEYRFYPFAHQRDDLSLNYTTVTTLMAQVTPRLRIQMTHNLGDQPKGSYQLQNDGQYYLLPSDESRNYALSSSVDYMVSNTLSLSIAPNYTEIARFGNQNGVNVPQRRSRTLNFDGSAHLNKPIGRGLLTGDIGRKLVSDRSTAYTNGVPQPSPRSEQSYWSGSLAFTWNL